MTFRDKLDSAMTGQYSGISSLQLGQEDFLKTVNCARDEFRHLAELWHNKLTRQGQSLAERYAKHGLTIICDLDIPVPLTEMGGDMRGNDEPVINREPLARFVYCADVPNLREFAVCKYEPMLVLNVELVEGPYSITIPSLVRLYDVNEEPDDLESGVLFQSAINGSFKEIFGVAHGKHRLRCPFEDNLMPSVVESRAKVVEGIAKDKQERVWKSGSGFDPYQIASSLQIVIDVDDVRVRQREGVSLPLKIVDVLLGPYDL